MFALAVDIGGSHVTCAVVEDTRVLARSTFPAHGSLAFAELLQSAAAHLRLALTNAESDIARCAGIAVAFCGLADARLGRILSTSSKYEDALTFDITAWARREFGLPVAIENDARMALLGERYAGAARGFEDVVMITLGTGVGGAAMIAGRLLRGKHGQAGCLGGHFPVRMNGRACGCGGAGCVEAEASTSALADIAREWPGLENSKLPPYAATPTFATLCEATDHGDVVATQIIEHCVDVWAHGAIAMIHAFDPEVLVIGGGVMQRADLVLPGIRRLVKERAWTPWGDVSIRAGMLGGDAALVGAVPLFEELQ